MTRQERETKYTVAVRKALSQQGHATNAEILAALRQEFPALSATTVHRATARMQARGELGIAPSSKRNTLRYDAIATPHDHFLCRECDMLRDTMVSEVVRPLVESAIGSGCSISGEMIISGICKKCHKEGM